VAGAANLVSNPDAALANVTEAARAALAQAGMGGRPLADLFAVLGLAGANVPSYADPFRARLPFGRAKLVSDAVTAARGALGALDGIVAAIGTGSVYCRQKGAAFHQIGGWGLVLGDEASGAWIGRALLTRALRARDGLAVETPLLAQALKDQGGPAATVAFARTATPGDFARLAPMVMGSDDPAAKELRDEAAGWIRKAIAALQDDIAPLPVVFLGGLGGLFAPLVPASDTGASWPVLPARGTGLDGAVQLAIAMTGGD
jgi:glucosamine kinase